MNAAASTDAPPWSGLRSAADDNDTERVCSLTLAAVPTAVSCSRQFVRFILLQWGCGFLIDRAELVASELVTNAVKTTGKMDTSIRCAFEGEIHIIQVHILMVMERIFIGVWDRDVNPPIMRTPGLDAENGRGMVLVDAMTKQWGHYHPAEFGGKVVWCELEYDPPTTDGGLPIRVSAKLPVQRMDIVMDPALLERVIARLRRM